MAANLARLRLPIQHTRSSAGAQSSPSLRAKRRNPASPRKERTDCFVAALLAMTLPRSRGADSARAMHIRCPQENRGRRESRTLGASAAACAVVESTRVSHHGHAGNVRHSPRNGFNGFLRALPRDRAFLPLSPPRSLLLRNLMPASGHQDHTTSPSASSAFVKALSASTASRTNVRDDREAPLLSRRDGESIKLFLPNREAKYFCKDLWTQNRATSPSGKSVA